MEFGLLDAYRRPKASTPPSTPLGAHAALADEAAVAEGRAVAAAARVEAAATARSMGRRMVKSRMLSLHSHRLTPNNTSPTSHQQTIPSPLTMRLLAFLLPILLPLASAQFNFFEQMFSGDGTGGHDHHPHNPEWRAQVDSITKERNRQPGRVRELYEGEE
ncbi:hypothetical protein OCS_03649 [Ophiocordyceps sinensis CO18]|uniref:Uncharacterized protein n=1 Tax=Ophiocordyceps sinensis (strain Co18 / CGMCC 3.14243) TaxID=911162 RepID=T5AFX8_OPHSC|nr:hypothetical protein OCS_03649 [Ophiocordyceps sinensis CO18]